MALHAVDALGDALSATQRFLFPPERGRWLRLAVVVFFVGGFGTSVPTNTGTSTSPPPDTPGPGPDLPADPLSAVPGDVWILAASILIAVVVVGSVLAFIGAGMEFVLVASLRDDEVRVRRYFRAHWRRGARLFGFRVGVTLLLLGTVAAAAALAATTLVSGPVTGWGVGEFLTVALVVVPVLVVMSLLGALVQGFTTAFVVPVMLAEDRTVLEGWRRFWPTLTGNPKEYAVYVVLAALLTLGFGVASAVALGLTALLLLIPFGLVGFAVVALAGGLSTLLPTVAVGLLVLLYVVVVLSVAAVVQVPLRTFMRYYTLLFLGETNDEFDLLPEVRAAIAD